MDSTQALFSLESLIVLVAATGIALLAGFLSGRSGRSALLDREKELLEQIQRTERQATDVSKKMVAKMRRELGTVNNLALALPQVVRDLNRDDVDPADVPRMIIQLANALFDPRQILLYGLEAADPVTGRRALALKAQRGLGEVPESLRRVRLGEGKIGWVAERQLDMLENDWATLRMTDLLDVPDNHELLKADIIGPLIHHANQKEIVLGVLCLGDPQIKPRDPKLMFQMVTNFGSLGFISTFNMKKLRSAAHHDGLTRLLNKRHFLEDVSAKTLVECERAGKPFSMFIFDIDHFKNFNDTNGHPAGDDLLRRMGELIRKHVRAGDVACRYGGEEFVIAMPDTERHVALEQAEALRSKIEKETFDHRENQPAGFVSISGGVATFPKDGSSVSDLIKRADETLYRSKKGGRNRVLAYKGVDIGDPTDLPPVLENLGDASGSVTDLLR